MPISYQTIVEHLKTRWPLWQRLRLLSDGSLYDFPPLMALCLSAAAENDGNSVCFVLPRKGDAARWAAVLTGLSKAEQTFYACNEERVRQNYEEGEAVHLFPSGHAFEFKGFRSEPTGQFFHLCSMRGNITAKFPVSELARIHPISETDTPESNGNSPRYGPPCNLERLLGIRTFGNYRMFHNRVLLIDSRTGFDEFARNSNLSVAEKPGEIFNIAKTLPHGPFGSKWMKEKPLDLVAITSSDEIAAKAARYAERVSLTIIANGLSHFRNLQSLEELAHGHKLIVFAEESEMQGERARVLADHGCRFWWLRDDLSLLETESDDALWLHQWASLRQELRIEAVGCKAPGISEAADGLRSLFPYLGPDASTEMRKINGRVWQLLLESSLWTKQPKANKLKHFHERLDKRKCEIEEAKQWIQQAAVEVFYRTLDHLRSYSVGGFAPGTSKASGLLTTAQSATAERQSVAVLVGDDAQAESVEAVLSQRNIQVDTCPKTVPDGSQYDHVICVGWTNRFTMRKLVDGCAAPRMSVLAFDFEKSWIEGFAKVLEWRPKSLELLPDEAKARMVAGNNPVEWRWPIRASKPPVTEQEFKTDAFENWFSELEIIQPRKGDKDGLPRIQGEEEIHALFVSFAGDGYAYLTSSHRVPCFVPASNGEPNKITEKKAGAIQLGDWVVFPLAVAGGMIAQVADAIAGDPAVVHRNRARQWRLALEEITRKGFSATEICKRASSYGHPLNASTVRIWIREVSDQIGPATRSDLEVIGKVARDFGVSIPNILGSLDVIWAAIQALRGAHISAGSQMNDVLLRKLPAAVSDLHDTGTRIDLGDLGTALLVRVEGVGELSELRARNLVNRYLED
ncbi:DrmE family protein [Prosthecobacter sp.]